MQMSLEAARKKGGTLLQVIPAAGDP